MQSLGLSQWAMTAAERLIRWIVQHQFEAVSKYVEQPVAIATGNASGKSAVFYCQPRNAVQDADSRILAIYPLKALGKEQETGGGRF